MSDPARGEAGDHRAFSFVLLAGGESRRMGRDKALLELGGRPLIVRLLQVGAMVSDDPVLVTNTPDRHGPPARSVDPRPRIVGDERPGRGPLAGIEAGLKAAHHSVAFVAACDLPFLTPRVVRLVVAELRAPVEADDPPPGPGPGREPVRPTAAVPYPGGRPQPLCAAYDRSAAEAAAACLEREEGSVTRFLDHLSTRRIPAARFEPHGDPERLFLNLNRPRDLRRARTLLQPAKTEA